MFEAEDHSDTIKQLSLFQDEHILLNGAIQDLHALRLEEAKKAFHEYQDIYPNGESVDDKLKLGLASMSHAHCFAPIENTAAIVLILGSMPGKASLAAGEYYAHPRNIFWPIMGELVGAHPGLPYEGRLRMLKSSGIALWDVLHSCIRKSSLDSDIEEVSVIPNDFESFFLRHPNIAHVFFNGAKAEQCFLRHVQPSPTSHSLQYQRLPSTSPANAGTPYGKKLDAWQAVMQRGLRFQRTASRRC